MNTENRKIEAARKVYEGSYIAEEGTVASLGLSEDDIKTLQKDTAMLFFSTDHLEKLTLLECDQPDYEDEHAFDYWANETDYLLSQHEMEFQQAIERGNITLPKVNGDSLVGVEVNYKGEEAGTLLLMSEAKKVMKVYVSRYNYL